MSPSDAATRSKRRTSGYRRNGSLKACEPCRKSKLRCDHGVPTCGRCVARGRRDKCVYHPAPLSRVSGRPRRTVNNISESPATASRSERCSSHVTNRSVSPSGPEKTARGGSQGFLGETSYSAILKDGIDHVSGNSPDSRAQLESLPISKDQVSQGCRALCFLEDREFVDGFVERWYKESEGSCVCPDFLMKEWLKGLWEQHTDIPNNQHPEPKVAFCCKI